MWDFSDGCEPLGASWLRVLYSKVGIDAAEDD